jgi:hypothetical protein
MIAHDLSIFTTNFTWKKTWTPTIIGDHAEIPLTRGMKALVSIEDLPVVSPFKWQARGVVGSGSFRAVSNRLVDGSMKPLHMSRLILQAPVGLVVDHISGDTLDNRRSNLRLCTLSQNSRNKRKKKGASSRYKGVTFHKQSGKWFAALKSSGRNINLGLFKTQEEAAIAYDNAAKIYFGDFARTNEMMFGVIA